MKYNKISRRMFLQGTGHFLFTIPFLESLLPRTLAHAQSVPIVRYIQLINQYSLGHGHYWGQMKALTEASNNIVVNGHPIRVANLADFASPFSRHIGPELSALRNKFTLIRGLDVQNPPDSALLAHNTIFPTCASPNKLKQDYTSPPLSDQESIDSLLARSSVVYPAGFPEARRQIVIGADSGDPQSANFTFSWKKGSDGVIRMIPAIKETNALLSLFQAGFTSQPLPTTNGSIDLMNAVYDDYKKVRDGTRISADDKLKLESYMSLIADIQRGLANTPPPPTAACTAPAIGPDEYVEDRAINHFRILVAALACNLTRVANFQLIFDRSDSHGISHNQQLSPDHDNYLGTVALHDNLMRFSKRVAFLINALEQIPDGGSTLLENSIVYWTSEFGVSQGLGSGHERVDFPVLVAGGAAGKFQHGRMLDYRMPNGSDWVWRNPLGPLEGIPINNLLVTFMNCMGLSSTDYERIAGQGYGYYSSTYNALRQPDVEFWYSTKGRRSPVPLLYTGPLMG